MKVKYTNDFAKEFAKTKFESGLTYKEIKKKTGIGVPRLCNYLKGKANPGLPSAILISRAMGFKLDNLKP